MRARHLQFGRAYGLALTTPKAVPQGIADSTKHRWPLDTFSPAQSGSQRKLRRRMSQRLRKLL